jgi:hypothetical protein
MSLIIYRNFFNLLIIVTLRSHSTPYCWDVSKCRLGFKAVDFDTLLLQLSFQDNRLSLTEKNTVMVLFEKF